MLLVSLLTLSASAHPDVSSCDRDFFQRLFPEGMRHRPPPLEPLLHFAWDGNADGRLDEGEQKALERDVRRRCEALQGILAELDADGDGTITPNERDEGLHSLFGPPPPPPRRAPDGARLPQLPPPVVFLFDTDRDRQLSEKEQQAARSEIQDRFRNGLPPLPPPERR